jgi:uncharacterized protein YutE (UPF0331/DUF86 family)
MTFLVERLADLRRHLDHLDRLRPTVRSAEELRANLSLHNDVLFSLLTVCQLVIDIAGELAGRRGDRYDDYVGAVRSLANDPRFPPALVRALAGLPGFRNVLVHEYVALDMNRVIDALDRLEPIRQFMALVADIERSAPEPDPQT